jgi:hypothetical protein
MEEDGAQPTIRLVEMEEAEQADTAWTLPKQEALEFLAKEAQAELE